MRWQGRRASTNVEDRRGRRIGMPIGVGGGAGLLILLAIALFNGRDPSVFLDQGGRYGVEGDGYEQSMPGADTNDPRAQFVAVVLADTEDVWHEQFSLMGRDYQEPRLVLFSQAVQSDCGMAEASAGPFYCPEDAQVYIDLVFFDELHRRFGAPGDFAQAYVIAHEVGHHIQNLLGISDRVQSLRGRASEEEYNKASVRLELQADFLAGVWAHHADRAKQVLESGDLEEALSAASAIGDDAIQRRSQGHVVPDSFTHGTSEQRVRWFRRGFETGDIRQGDTFSVPESQL